MREAPGYVYVASPYTGTPEEMAERAAAVGRYCAAQLTQGEVVLSPVVYGHTLYTQNPGLGNEQPMWFRVSATLLRHAYRVDVLKLDGWYTSKGVQFEIELAKSMGIPVRMVEPCTK